MPIDLLTRSRSTSGQDVREPTVLTFTLTVAGLLLLLGLCVVAVAALPAFGHVWWTFAAVSAVLAWLVLGFHRTPHLESIASTGRRRWLRRILRGSRGLFIGVLGCWLGLILWSVVCPGGPTPSPKADPSLIRVVTWNIHCGQDSGLPWQQFDWPGRKGSLRLALDQAAPDILCVQEATPVQVAFLEEALPGHRRVGIGRDGEADGEHCAVFFNHRRFEEVGSGTFWLEEPIDQPRPGSALDVKRICTWVRLRDRVSGRTLRVYNTHLPLTEGPRMTAARVILDQIAAGDSKDAVLLTADFNATPSAPSRQKFREAGLTDSAERACRTGGQRTLQLYGIGLRNIDGILTDGHWRVQEHHVLKMKLRNTFPSDHFGLLADLALTD